MAEYENPAAKALKKPNPFTDGSFDGTTKIGEGAGYNPYDNPNKGQINIIDGEEFEVPANAKIIIPNPEDPNEIIEVDNTSRGTLGFVSNPEKIAELKAQGLLVNDNKPLSPSVAEMQKRFDNKKEDKVQLIRIRAEKAIKSRCKMQHAPYNPPDDLKDVPALAPYDPEKDNLQNVKPEADSSLGEVILDDNENTPASAAQAATTTPAMKIEDEDTSASATGTNSNQ